MTHRTIRGHVFRFNYINKRYKRCLSFLIEIAYASFMLIMITLSFHTILYDSLKINFLAFMICSCIQRYYSIFVLPEGIIIMYIPILLNRELLRDILRLPQKPIFKYVNRLSLKHYVGVNDIYPFVSIHSRNKSITTNYDKFTNNDKSRM